MGAPGFRGRAVPGEPERLTSWHGPDLQELPTAHVLKSTRPVASAEETPWCCASFNYRIYTALTPEDRP